jgi:hypothetical protein
MAYVSLLDFQHDVSLCQEEREWMDILAADPSIEAKAIQ